MSFPRGVPSDIFVNEPLVNRAYVEYEPITKIYRAKADAKYCALEGEGMAQDPKNTKCERCGCPSLIFVKKGTRLYPADKGPIAHFSRKVSTCWNSTTDPETDRDVLHDLEEGVRDVVNLSTEEFHKETYCKKCGAAYTWVDGRRATSEELQLAREGKIPPPTQRRLVMGANF